MIRRTMTALEDPLSTCQTQMRRMWRKLTCAQEQTMMDDSSAL